MDNPGVSLFNNGVSLQLDAVNQQVTNKGAKYKYIRAYSDIWRRQSTSFAKCYFTILFLFQQRYLKNYFVTLLHALFIMSLTLRSWVWNTLTLIPAHCQREGEEVGVDEGHEGVLEGSGHHEIISNSSSFRITDAKCIKGDIFLYNKYLLSSLGLGLSKFMMVS